MIALEHAVEFFSKDLENFKNWWLKMQVRYPEEFPLKQDSMEGWAANYMRYVRMGTFLKD